MKRFVKIAWLNIWRNKRRTFITISSIMFALFFALLMRGFQEGSYDNMKQNAVEIYSGYVQIHKNGYWADKSIDNSFNTDSLDISGLLSDSRISSILPRIESFALASGSSSSKVVQVLGIDPLAENKMTMLKKYLIKGEYLNNQDKGVLIGEELARYLNLKITDSIVLFTSGYHGATAAAIFQVKGILKLPAPEMNRSSLYMPVSTAQNFFGANNLLSSYVFDIVDIKQAESVSELIKSKVDPDYFEVMDWRELNKELVQMIESDRLGGVVMIGILYLVIAFGIFGTVLMMTNERIREFSMMVSVGMQKYKLAAIVALELIFITTLGVIAGVLIASPLMLYFYYNPIYLGEEMAKAMEDFNFEPIMPMSLDSSIFIFQAVAITIISLIAISYPSIKILTLDVIKGLKS